MPAHSVAQQQAAAIALHHPSKAKTDMGGMAKKELRKFAKTPSKGLPQHVKHESMARTLIERDDAPSLGLGKTGLKFARMGSKEAFKTTNGTDKKWKTSLKLRTELAGEKPGMKMKSVDKVGPVPSAIKDSITPQQVVQALLSA